jgi:hypothetical protein
VLVAYSQCSHATGGKETMMDKSPETRTDKSPKKSPKTRTELEALVLAELRAAPRCGGALHVTVVPYDDYRVPATWEVASFNPGTSEQETCEVAVCDIVSRLQKRFDIS